MMAGAMVLAEDPLPHSQTVPADTPSFVVDTTVQVNPNGEAVSGSNVDRARAVIGQAVVVGDTGTGTFTDADQKSTPDEGSQPDDLRAVDTALESWDRPTACDVATRCMPDHDASNDEDADQLWSDGDLDWFPAKVHISGVIDTA